MLSFMENTHIKTACDIVGGQAAMARILGVSTPTINQWVSGDRPIPESRGPSIEKSVFGKVICDDLCPDVSWVRIPDPDWPHPNGRPLVDHSQRKAA